MSSNRTEVLPGKDNVRHMEGGAGLVPSKAEGCAITSISTLSVSTLQPNPEKTRSQRFRSISL